MKVWLCIQAALAVVSSISVASSSPLPKKLIVTGWDNPDTSQFRRDLQAMEKWPFQGAVVYAEGKDKGSKRFDARRAFSTNHWERSFFSDALADLKAAHSAKLTDNFLLCGANPGDVDWFDDSGWKEIEDHWRTLAWLAHEGGLKGLVFDPEAYTEPFKQFDYGSQANRAQHSFADYCQKARERGGQVMRAIASEFPNVVILNYFLFSYCTDGLVRGANQQAELDTSGTGLLSPFADGWLDALPPTAVLVDGNERAYYYSGSAAFSAAFVQLKNDCQALVSPENRAKFRAQLQVGHGIYLDLCLQPIKGQPNAGGSYGSKGARLEADVLYALQAADEYVWVYGQKARWWPPRQPAAAAPPTWPEVFPGVDSALLSALKPSEGAQRRLADLRKRDGVANLVANGEFNPSRIGLPSGWPSWQRQDSHGTFNVDPNVGSSGKGAGCIASVKRGCFYQSIRVKPGQRLVLSVKVLQEGAGSPWLRVRWEDTDGKSLNVNLNADFGATAGESPSAWREIAGTVVVPLRASRLIFQLGVTGQQSANDRVWFDDACVAPWED